MAIKSINELKRGKIQIDLTGPEGNAYFILGTAKNLCRQLKKDFESISKEMMDGDYDHLLEVFDREFGMYVDLYKR